jgi:fused signal recognition particle receptor
MGIFSKLFNGLKKTKTALSEKLKYVFSKNELDDDFFEELEYVLVSSDIDAETTETIIDEMRTRAKERLTKNADDAKEILKEILIEKLEENELEEYEYPLVIMVVGVNGVGKTTTIGKLANYFVENKKSVVIAAADTFRAAASEQLSVWADRAKVKIVKSEEGTDAGAVVFDAIKSAKAKNTDVVIIDTAGRLHNKSNLIEELKKISRVVEREYPEANYHKFLVLDGTTGQNAFNQLEAFDEAVGVTDLVVTKLDGTSKAGFLVGLQGNYSIPIRYVGVGEGIDDLLEFNAKDFVDSII